MRPRVRLEGSRDIAGDAARFASGHPADARVAPRVDRAARICRTEPAGLHYHVAFNALFPSTMPAIVMYTTGFCPYCVAAKNFLKRLGASWQEVRVDVDPSRRAEMLDRAKRASVPQIFVGDRHVGGYEDLVDLDRSGELRAMLEAAA